MARRNRLANPLLDGPVIKGCIPNIVLVVHDSAFREPLPGQSSSLWFVPAGVGEIVPRRGRGDERGAAGVSNFAQTWLCQCAHVLFSPHTGGIP
jgi:hypothetical protein